MITTFDVPTVIKVDPGEPGWPHDSALDDDSCLGGNLSFFYIGKTDWTDAEEVVLWERDFVLELEKADFALGRYAYE